MPQEVNQSTKPKRSPSNLSKVMQHSALLPQNFIDRTDRKLSEVQYMKTATPSERTLRESFDVSRSVHVDKIICKSISSIDT